MIMTIISKNNKLIFHVESRNCKNTTGIEWQMTNFNGEVEQTTTEARARQIIIHVNFLKLWNMILYSILFSYTINIYVLYDMIDGNKRYWGENLYFIANIHNYMYNYVIYLSKNESLSRFTSHIISSCRSSQ